MALPDPQGVNEKYFSPRLLDYIVIVGSRNPSRNNSVAQTPELLRRYPLEDHKDFPLPPDVVFFCQPEGCISSGPKRMSLRESTSFVFTLTEKDTGRSRYGICVNFYRSFDRKISHSDRTRGEHRGSPHYHAAERHSSLGVPHKDEDTTKRSPRTRRKEKTASRVRTNTLTSLCLISHHPFFTTFRECLFVLRKLIDACSERSSSRRIGASKMSSRDTVWGLLTGAAPAESTAGLVMHEVREIETWMLRLLSAPVPVPGKTRVEVQVLPIEVHAPLVFALPDHTRFSLVDFPLHLPLELLGVDTCLKVLTLILLEHKLILQSRDYNALTMSVMAFVSMLYPLEYMFPVIPLLPTCMSSAEQLLLAPTPFIIGVPSSFLMYKKNFQLPNDVWLIDLDSNNIVTPSVADDLPILPEPEGTVLKNHLKQILDIGSMWYEQILTGDQGIALASMSMTPQPIKNLETLAQNPDLWKRRESFSSTTGFNPLIYGNDVDSVDVATRVAMVRFFNSPNVMGNFTEHTRTLRLYPRPVVAFQLNSFMKSRPIKTSFTAKLSRTQAVEFFAEWALSPKNVVFLRVQTGVFDPLLIGDKAKWYSQNLQKMDFKVYDESSSTLGQAITTALEKRDSDENPTDESGSDSDGAESTSSSYSSLSDFVIDIQNSEINGETPEIYAEDQVMTVDESRVFCPPSKLHIPDAPVSNSDSALSAPDSDDNEDSSDSSSPRYAAEPERPPPSREQARQYEGDHFVYDNLSPSAKRESNFRYDSGNATPTSKADGNFRYDSGSSTPTAKGEGRFRYDSGGSNSPTSRHQRYENEPYPSGPPMHRQGSRGSLGGPRTPPLQRTPELRRREPPPIPPPPHSPSLRTGSSIDSGVDSMGNRMDTRSATPPLSRRTDSLRSVQSSSSATYNQNIQFARQGQAHPHNVGQGTPQQRYPQAQSPGQTTRMGQSPPKTQVSMPQGQGVNQQVHSQSGSQPPPRPPRPGSMPMGPPRQGSGAGGIPPPLDGDRSPSLISAISNELNDYAQTASNTISELFGIAAGGSTAGTGTKATTPSKSTKPFAPLGNRKALVEKAGLVKHATNPSQRKPSMQRTSSVESKTSTHSENQQFLKDMIQSVLDGQGVGFWKLNRVKKLMEDENYRNFVVSRLNISLDRKLTEDDQHIEDIPVSRSVFKGMLTMVKALISGLEFTYQNQGIGGMASALLVLEIIHTHYWEKDAFSSGRSDTSNQSVTSSPFGSRESLSSLTETPGKPADNRNWQQQQQHSQQEEQMVPAVGSPVIVNGDEFENIELRKASDINYPHLRYDSRGIPQQPNHGNHGNHGNRNLDRNVDNNDNSKTQEFLELTRNIANLSIGHQLSSSDSEKQQQRELSSGYGSESGDMLREMVKNKDLMKPSPRKKELPRYSSIDSDVSEGSTLVSTGSDILDENGSRRRKARINHHSIRNTMSDTEAELQGMMNFGRKKRSGSILSVKSQLSTGYRYHEGKMLNLNLPSPDSRKTYLFEALIGKDRSWLWDQMQFWEDAFLDAVAQERDIIGMDQGPTEMMERYRELSDTDKKRLEHDEDRLLAILLYNMVGFMVMVRVSKNELRRKCRRLLGKCHVGLLYSQEINILLDQINNLHGNDIDLKPLGSRLMQKQSFTVHWGPDNTGDMLFMEVCDDCIILRSVTGAICDRWWYEKLVNMTYCPKTKVLCLWRKHGDKTQLNKFYTKKCKDLYFCVKEAMERAAARNNGKVPGPELGGEFPIQDMKTGQGGLLQVCMEGIGLLFANSKDFEFFIELSRIKKCFTQKDGIFVLEEFDPKTRKVIQHKYKSNMCDQICYAVLCVFSYVAAGMEQRQHLLEQAQKERIYKTL